MKMVWKGCMSDTKQSVNTTIKIMEVCFSCKHNNVYYQSLTFNSNSIQSPPAQKHLALALGFKLDFNKHIDGKISKYIK